MATVIGCSSRRQAAVAAMRTRQTTIGISNSADGERDAAAAAAAAVVAASAPLYQSSRFLRSFPRSPETSRRKFRQQQNPRLVCSDLSRRTSERRHRATLRTVFENNRPPFSGQPPARKGVRARVCVRAGSGVGTSMSHGSDRPNAQTLDLCRRAALDSAAATENGDRCAGVRSLRKLAAAAEVTSFIFQGRHFVQQVWHVTNEWMDGWRD
jgi:hypothetical protein